jgi:clathrin heavy chain
MKIVVLPDHLEDLIKHYEKFGFNEELINLLEQGMSLERSHQGIYTELGILYAKFNPQRLLDHIRTYAQKIMIPKLVRACEQYQMWPEAVFLHSQYGQFDQAVITMMEHSPTAWKHDLFSQNIVKVSNHDLYYRAMIFYLEEEPMLLNDLLKLLAMKIDLTKCVQVMKRTGYIALITPFLKSVQNQNISAVNEALNEIYLENEDYESLRQSIKEFDSFESLKLAQDLERHELLECRRIAALLYRMNKRFQQSIDISKKDELYKDAMETVAESRDPALAEDLMRHIMHMEDKELFAAMLYTCYELVKPDVALEVAWRCGLYEYVMPYFIQFVKDLSGRVDIVQKKTDDIKKKEEKNAQEQMSQPLDIDIGGFLFPGMNPGMAMPALMPPPGMMPNMNMGGFSTGFNTGAGAGWQ